MQDHIFEVFYDEFPGIMEKCFGADGNYSFGVSNSGFGGSGRWNLDGDTIFITGEVGDEDSQTTFSGEIKIISINAKEAYVIYGGKKEHWIRDRIAEMDKLVLNNEIDAIKKIVTEDGIKQRFFADFTLLHFAARHGKIEIAQYLLKQGADISAQTAAGDTPLHFAARENQVDMIDFLIKNGADPRIKNIKDHTPLDIAREYEKGDALSFLENLAKNPDEGQ